MKTVKRRVVCIVVVEIVGDVVGLMVTENVNMCGVLGTMREIDGDGG